MSPRSLIDEFAEVYNLRNSHKIKRFLLDILVMAVRTPFFVWAESSAKQGFSTEHDCQEEIPILDLSP